MRNSGFSINPYERFIIDGSEVQNEPLAVLAIGGAELSSIPTGFEKTLVGDTAGIGLGGKRHLDVAIPLYLSRHVPFGICIDGKIPLSIQRHPTVAFQLWSWVWVAWG